MKKIILWLILILILVASGLGIYAILNKDDKIEEPKEQTIEEKKK